MISNPHDVQAGDEYVDLEFAHRNDGAERRIRIDVVHDADGYCTALSLNTNRKVVIKLSRFKPSKSGVRGYRLASRASAAVTEPASEETRPEV